MSYGRFSDPTNSDYGRRPREPPDERPGRNRNGPADYDTEAVNNNPPAEGNYQHYQRPNAPTRISGVGPAENGHGLGNRDASSRDHDRNRNRDRNRDRNDRVYDGGRRSSSRSRSREFHSRTESNTTRRQGGRLEKDYDGEGGGGRGAMKDRQQYGRRDVNGSNGNGGGARGDDYRDKREINRGGDDARGRSDPSASSNWRDPGRGNGGVDREAGTGDRRTGDRRRGGDSREPRRDYFGARDGRELSVVEKDRSCDGRGLPERGGYDGGSRGECMVKEDRPRYWSRGSRDDRGSGRDNGRNSFGSGYTGDGRNRGRNDSRERQRQQQRDQQGYEGRDSFRGGSGAGGGRDEFVSRNRRYPEDDRSRRYPEREGIGRDYSYGDRHRGEGSRGDDNRPRVGGFRGGRGDSRDRSRQRRDDGRREVDRRGYGYGDARDDGGTGARPRSSRLDSNSSHVAGFVDGQWVEGAGVSSFGGVQEEGNSQKYGDEKRAATTTSGMSSARAPIGSSLPGAPSGIPVNSSGSGRPRWDKPAPGAVAKEAIAAIERKVSNNGPVQAQQQRMNNKLVWGSGKNAGGKRPLWGAGGGAAGPEARYATSSAASTGAGTPKGGSSSDNRADVSEQRWQEAAAALGPAERQVKFLRLLGAKKGAAAAAAAAAVSTAGPTNGNPGSSDSGVDSSRAENAKVMQDLEMHYQKAHRAHFGSQRGLGT